MIPIVTVKIVVSVYCPFGCHVLKDVQIPVRFEGKVPSNCMGQVICDSFALRVVLSSWYYPTVLHTPEVVYGFCVILTFITSNDQIGENRPVCTGPDSLILRALEIAPHLPHSSYATAPGASILSLSPVATPLLKPWTLLILPVLSPCGINATERGVSQRDVHLSKSKNILMLSHFSAKLLG
ncbi:hypothetical protein AVEN_72044-1 [Araneus ventricosus]|uniref:Uncharacterized protein n=1 Tax=Araneus ventricosus TaxID=182803 RepID=A0A4Y2KIB9_ARAVE|nr:hypothetical protein AVEN_72044-1 [Araneus ventricosus]